MEIASQSHFPTAFFTPLTIAAAVIARPDGSRRISVQPVASNLMEVPPTSITRILRRLLFNVSRP